MAFKRKVEMTVGENIVDGGTGLDISNLDIIFNITRTLTLSSNSASFDIYNAKQETRDDILKKGNVVIFKAGYEDEDNVGTIFIGSIIESKTRKDNTDFVTELECLDFASNKEGLKFETISLSYAAGTQTTTLIDDIVNILNIAIAGQDNVTSTLNNGFVFAGTRGKLLKRLKKILFAEDLGLYFDSSEMVIYKLGEADSTFGIVRVTPNSGLIGTIEDITDEDDEDDKKRVKFKSLLNAKIKPNTVINAEADINSGTYIVEKVTFVGDNIDGDFFAEVEAVE